MALQTPNTVFSNYTVKTLTSRLSWSSPLAGFCFGVFSAILFCRRPASSTPTPLRLCLGFPTTLTTTSTRSLATPLPFTFCIPVHLFTIIAAFITTAILFIFRFRWIFRFPFIRLLGCFSTTLFTILIGSNIRIVLRYFASCSKMKRELTFKYFSS